MASVYFIVKKDQFLRGVFVVGLGFFFFYLAKIVLISLLPCLYKQVFTALTLKTKVDLQCPSSLSPHRHVVPAFFVRKT